MSKKKYDVIFINYNLNDEKAERVIGHATTRKGFWRVVNTFIKKCNENKPEDKKFKSYYANIYVNPRTNRYRVDVGSHSEFFEVDTTIKLIGE